MGSLYKEVAKTTSGTLVYRFKRQTERKENFPSKNTESSTENVGFSSQEPSDGCILYFNVIFPGK